MSQANMATVLENTKLSDSLSFRVGYLHCEEVKLSKLHQDLVDTEQQPSPVFVFSTAEIRQNVAAYKDTLEQYSIPHILGYAVKANYNPKILSLLLSLGCSAVTVSGHEILAVLKCGFSPRNIVFNGNGKTGWELGLAIKEGCLINADSAFDLDNIIAEATKQGTTARVMLRINPNIDPNVHQYLATGLGLSKFGVYDKQLPDILQTLKSSEHATLVGLHIHLGSTIENVELFSEALEVMLALTKKVVSMGFTQIQYLNLGGGLGINYTTHINRTSGCNSAENPKLVPHASKLILAVKDQLLSSGLTLILEPGRSIIGSAGTLLTKVIGVKQNGEQRYIVVDGSMNEVIRPSLYAAYHHIELTQPAKSKKPHNGPSVFDIVGPVCECADFLGKERYLPEPSPGSGLAVLDAGAYCGSMAANYNLRLRPCEVLIDGNKWSLIRRADVLEDIMAPYQT